jgi:hypothetical protein
MASDFPGAFAGLRAILKRHSAGMIVQSDTPTDYTVVTAAIGPNRKPIWFGAVLSKKSAVTYHLLPLYFNPALEAKIPPELLKRKQGKACFNFQRPDAALFTALDAVTKLGRENYARHGLLKPGTVSNEQLSAMYSAAGGDVDALAKRRKATAKRAAAKRAATIKKKAGKKQRTRKSTK